MRERTRSVAILETLLCAFIWGSSFVGVKIVLRYTGPLTVAGIRYFLAFLLLLPWLIRRTPNASVLWRTHRLRLTLMGLAQYTFGNGALFIALQTIPATTVSLSMSFLPIPVAFIAYLRMRERPRALQLAGILTATVGGLIFFSPGIEGSVSALGWGALLFGLGVLALYPVLAREVARVREISTLALTAFPLGIGGATLLLLAAGMEGIPAMPAYAWGVLIGLAVINTLVAYLLYTHALQRLHAVEANIMLNLTPVGTALIAWAALGERLQPIQLGAMVLIIGGATCVQWRRRPS